MLRYESFFKSKFGYIESNQGIGANANLLRFEKKY